MKTLKLVPLFVVAALLLLTPQAQPVVAQAAPKGEKTADGIRYVFPSMYGKGSVMLSREGGYLRVDVDTVLPYDNGDGKKYAGSATEILLSVDGANGRRMLVFPSRVWQPDPLLPEFRVEVVFDKDGKQARTAETLTFAATSNVKFWDRFQVTIWVNLAKVTVPGNSADKVSNDWKLGVISGNYLGTAAFPEGVNVENPAANVAALMNVKVSELPERAKPRTDPFLAAVQREKNLQMDLQTGAQFMQQKQYKQAFDAFKALIKTYPEHLAPRYISWLLADRIPATVKEDALPLLKDYVEACPSQLFNVNMYLTQLMVNGKDTDAFAFYDKAATSPLASIPARKTELEMNWAKALVDNGYVAKAEPLVQTLLANPHVKDNGVRRVEMKELLVRALEAKGDSKGAQAGYAALLSEEHKVLFPVGQDGAEIKSDKALYFEQMVGQHELAVAHWNEELKLREEDAKQKQPRITLETTKGKVVIELFQDDAPNTVASLVSLVKKRFYDGLTFHNFVPGFMVQGGDSKGDGSGFPGYRLESEGTAKGNRRNFFRGTVAMTCLAPNTDTEGSGFMIATQNSRNTLSLNGKLVVVGRVIEGIEVVDLLRKGDKIKTATVTNLRDGTKYEPKTLPQ
ncbi:MAG: peptidylprolyl isomerase [Planctomycetes bacterium]|nr:peptidylprolyl isomerase [Planctomycetota bacterium]